MYNGEYKNICDFNQTSCRFDIFFNKISKYAYNNLRFFEICGTNHKLNHNNSNNPIQSDVFFDEF